MNYWVLKTVEQFSMYITMPCSLRFANSSGKVKHVQILELLSHVSCDVWLGKCFWSIHDEQWEWEASGIVLWLASWRIGSQALRSRPSGGGWVPKAFSSSIHTLSPHSTTTTLISFHIFLSLIASSPFTISLTIHFFFPTSVPFNIHLLSPTPPKNTLKWVFFFSFATSTPLLCVLYVWWVVSYFSCNNAVIELFVY